MRVGETVQNTLKGGWNRKEGRGNKDFKKGGELGQEVDALKNRWAGSHLPTMIPV